jgi:hypothetical protein
MMAAISSKSPGGPGDFPADPADFALGKEELLERVVPDLMGVAALAAGTAAALAIAGCAALPTEATRATPLAIDAHVEHDQS